MGIRVIDLASPSQEGCCLHWHVPSCIDSGPTMRLCSIFFVFFVFKARNGLTSGVRLQAEALRGYPRLVGEA